ncbi:hypothetical protein CP8484711_2118B, partial [Chlamydia psittaci 84-8471/1]
LASTVSYPRSCKA